MECCYSTSNRRIDVSCIIFVRQNTMEPIFQTNRVKNKSILNDKIRSTMICEIRIVLYVVTRWCNCKCKSFIDKYREILFIPSYDKLYVNRFHILHYFLLKIVWKFTRWFRNHIIGALVRKKVKRAWNIISKIRSKIQKWCTARRTIITGNSINFYALVIRIFPTR